ncbi:uncharacterized protein F5147DRAFT_812283 [Suillus discolor]|uniref:CxC2-like cysteine cluster KDZ transposase-associated domain-containing protein n=1 Tax=Suillus discolor TaxID=1912936 RepID=A0A9P7JR80_9AGAM|nr:uncharacterized protein F5147DRAFT_812283 [Suillus discolor]KAG2101317.1 hypothetical protein F5147DRAFT_812283 [Suillus discolor]
MLSQFCHGLHGCDNEPVYRCSDCEGLQMYCQSCVVALHCAMPLHHVEVWTGEYFQCTSLRDLGLRMQLGHPPGVSCCNPVPAFDAEFTVLNTNGIHSTHAIQLLRARWYPATSTDPRTAATFRLLDHFQMYTFESKGSAFEYYQALSRLTDNTGAKRPKDRYESLLRISRQYRHLIALKRAGRAHDISGILGTESGELAVVCPACPQPGKNLPPHWADAPKEKQWLYSLFVGIDANFRMCRRNKSSEQADPSFSQGWAYFVEDSGFKSVLDTHAGLTQEKSSCTSHNAVNLADSKRVRGLAATGIGAVVCARHNFKRPSAVGDLQKGERYVNMDYLFFSTMTHSSEIVVVNVSYDIACQWNKHLWERMSRYPSNIHLAHTSKTITFLVPKFHLPAHVAPCQTKFSFNLIKGMARTDGEAPERGWSNINPVATSTREMGPGSRRDALDDHFGDWNWRKVSNFGVFLLQKLKDAIPQRDQHISDLVDFEDAIPAESLATWRTMVEGWETDRSNANPFDSASSPMTQASVRLELSQVEANQLKRGLDMSLHSEVSPSVLIVVGIELETQHIGAHATEIQLSTLQQRTNTLRRRIEHWIKIQTLYMPCVARLREMIDATSDNTEEDVHSIKLWMPSAIVTQSLSCDRNLLLIEWKLRRAQGHEALHELHQHLRLKRHLTGFKKDWITSQRGHTRSRGIIDTVQKKIDAAATKYRIAWASLSALAEPLLEIEWKAEFPVLEKEDVRGMTEDQAAGESISEGRRLVSISWIWKQRYGAGEEELSDAMRIEWCKARARAHRWSEEVELLQEEMRRVLAFFDWHAAWWVERATSKTWLGLIENEGAVAYAHRQAAIRRMMRDHCSSIWSVVPGLIAQSSCNTAI